MNNQYFATEYTFRMCLDWARRYGANAYDRGYNQGFLDAIISHTIISHTNLLEPWQVQYIQNVQDARGKL